MNLTDLIGKEFELAARGPDKYDCWGVCIEVSKRMGKELPDFFYNKESQDELLSSIIDDNKDEVLTKIDKPEAGDIVLLKVVPKMTTHTGIMLDSVRFIHITSKTRSCIERIDSPLWSRRVKGFYRRCQKKN